MKGNRIFVEYPDNLTESGPYNVGRDRISPTMSWGSIQNSVLQWMDLDDENCELDYCLPNGFQAGTKLLFKEDIFVD